jgi:hypothetical protein
MIDNTDYLKEEFFNTLFEQQVKRYEGSRDGKTMDVSMVCNNAALDNHFRKLFEKYKIKNSHADYMNECIFWTYKAIQRFEVKDEGSWEGMIAGTDKPNIGRMINNIKTTVGFEIYKFANGDAKFTRGEVDGRKGEHITVKMDTSSLDTLLGDGSGGDSLLDILSEEHSLWSNKEEQYSLSYFSKWFEDNKESLLMPSQLKLLTDLNQCRKIEGYTTNDVYEVTGVPSFKINTKLKRMAARIERSWAKENPLQYKNRLEMERDKELLLWDELLSLVEDEEDLKFQNLRITTFLMDHYETEKVANLIVDNLQGDDIILFNRIYKNQGLFKMALPGEILYSLIAKVIERTNTLHNTDCHLTTTQPQAKAISLPDNRHQPCYVYDQEGTLLRTEDWKPYKQSNTNILYVLPTGVRVTAVGG